MLLRGAGHEVGQGDNGRRQMLRSGVKMELEALISKDISFITRRDLPRKVSDGDLLD